MDSQRILNESYVVAIHPSGQVYALRDKRLIALRLNPRAIVNATMDECGVEDFPVMDACEPKPVSAIGGERFLAGG